MSQPVTSSRLTNSAVNIIGATTAISTNFGLSRIGVTGNSFDISSSGSGTVTLGITGSGNVQLGNATSGTVSLPGVTTFASLNGATTTSAINIGSNLIAGGTVVLGSTASTTNLFGILDVANIEGPTAGSALTIGNNISSGSISIGNAGGPNTITIGSNGAGPTGTVNVGVSSSTVNVGGTGTSIYIGNIGTGSGVIGINAVSLTLGTTTNSVSVGNNSATGAGVTGSVQIGRGAANINIGNLGNSDIVIGNTGGSVTLKCPLTLGTVAPGIGQLGYNPEGTSVTTTLPANSTTTLQSIVLPAGAWIVSGNCQFTATTEAWVSISTTSARDANAAQTSNGTGSILSINVTRILQITSSTTFNLVAFSFAGGVSNIRYSALRVG